MQCTLSGCTITRCHLASVMYASLQSTTHQEPHIKLMAHAMELCAFISTALTSPFNTVGVSVWMTIQQDEAVLLLMFSAVYG